MSEILSYLWTFFAEGRQVCFEWNQSPRAARAAKIRYELHRRAKVLVFLPENRHDVRPQSSSGESGFLIDTCLHRHNSHAAQRAAPISSVPDIRSPNAASADSAELPWPWWTPFKVTWIAVARKRQK